jgi:hypothetical protein
MEHAMRTIKTKLTLTAAALTLSMSAAADHNSKWGEGWANMPNDIHNTRIETRGDNTSFRDFVRKGAGADSVNRFSAADRRGRADFRSRGSAAGSRSGSARAGGRGGRR